MASLFVHGALAPLDPLSGAVAGAIWQADGCEVASETVDAEVTSHPRQRLSGEAGQTPATEARLERAETIQVEFKLTDAGSVGHPRPGSVGRAAKLAAELKALARDPRLLVAWIGDLNDNAPIKDVAIGSLTISKGSGAEVRVSATISRVVFADTREAPIVVDADLVAAGLG